MDLKPFYHVAIPHNDIKEGKFTLDTFAADLWSVYQNKGPLEYRNPKLFWERTYPTRGLITLLELAEKRLQKGVGDAVIQLQTPFGGGKTHSLIALYHRAREWNANVVVLDGTVFDAKEVRLWEEMERQLTGKVERMRGDTSPGKAKIMDLLEEKKPVLILIDELLEYMTKAAGIKVGETTLADQTLAFIHELTEAVKATDRTFLVMTLPSSILEHYSEKAEEYFQKLQKISGRAEKVFTPVQDEEIYDVVRKRLFKRIDDAEMERIVKKVVEYLEKENLIPEGITPYQYRERFLRSYPFQPEVIDVLYKRWGSLPKFQRTRGVLRLLAIVVHSNIGKELPFIRLADFDLGIKDLRDELVSVIGESRYYSVLDADILSPDSGAKRVDRELGESYVHYRIGTKAATVIFMYSFSSGELKGATTKEIKLSTADLRYPSSIVGDAILMLKDNLLYLHYRDGRYFFSLEPSLNKLLLDEMNNVTEEEIEELERSLLKSEVPGRYFRPYLWPKDSRDIPDNDPTLKLVVLREYDSEKVYQILNSSGSTARVYKNTLIFLVPRETERVDFNRKARKYIAWERIKQKSDRGQLELTKEQKEDVRLNVKKAKEDVKQKISELYRVILLPTKQRYEELDLGMKPVGEKSTIEKRVYEKLKSEGKLIETMAPIVIEKKYLDDKEYIFTDLLYESFLKTPGMPLVKSKKVLADAIKEGVKRGMFGLGYVKDEIIRCEYLGEGVSPTFEEGEAIIRKDVCESLRVSKEEEGEPTEKEGTGVSEKEDESEVTKKRSPEREGEPVSSGRVDTGTTHTEETFEQLDLRLELGSGVGGLRTVISVLNFLRNRFDDIEVTIEIKARNGKLTKREYEEKVLEALEMAGIKVGHK